LLTKEGIFAKVYIPFADDRDLNWDWPPAQLKAAVRMWTAGVGIYAMANSLQRDPDEVTLLLMSLRRQDIINNRPSGWQGGR